MFYTLELENYPNTEDFKDRFGFYKVKNASQNITTVEFYNPVSNNWFTMALNITEIPQEFLDNWEEKDVEPPKEPSQQDRFVSENFALKAMALAKANTNTIKVSDILNS